MCKTYTPGPRGLYTLTRSENRVKGKIGRSHTLKEITLITMQGLIKKKRCSLESRCTVNKREIRDQDKGLRLYDPKTLKFIVIITIKGVYNM